MYETSPVERRLLLAPDSKFLDSTRIWATPEKQEPRKRPLMIIPNVSRLLRGYGASFFTIIRICHTGIRT